MNSITGPRQSCSNVTFDRRKHDFEHVGTDCGVLVSSLLTGFRNLGCREGRESAKTAKHPDLMSAMQLSLQTDSRSCMSGIGQPANTTLSPLSSCAPLRVERVIAASFRVTFGLVTARLQSTEA
jgi:hypothetical protein